MPNYNKFNVFDKANTRNYIHNHVTAYMTDAIKMDIICINKLVREGKSYKEIANIMSVGRHVKPTEVKRLHYGHAPNRYLSPDMKKEIADAKPNGWIESKHHDKIACVDEYNWRNDPKYDDSIPLEEITGTFYNCLYRSQRILKPEECPDNMPIPIEIYSQKLRQLSKRHKQSTELNSQQIEHNEQYGQPDGMATYVAGTYKCYSRHVFTSYSMCKVYAMYLGACCHINR